MGSRIRDANESADCEITAVDSNTNSNEVAAGTLQLQEIPGTQCEEFKDLKVHRSFVEKDILQHFRDSSCLSAQLTFTILNEKGDAEMGAGAGVTRAVFTLFWKQFANYMTVWERERVPFIQHDHFIDEWEAVARILVKGYEMVSYFPTYLSKAFLSFCLFGLEVPDSVVLDLILKYLSHSKEESVKEYLVKDTFPDNIEDQGGFLDFLERFKCQTVVKKDNINSVITEIGQQELVQKPHLMVATWQPIL